MSERPLPLEWVRAFEAAGRLGSFIAAADDLSITQAAISQRIGQLEARLGVRLFLRKPRGVALTVEGEAWLPHITTHLRAIHQTADDLFGHGPRRVTIAASASVIQGWLVPRLNRITPKDRLEFSFSTMVLEEDFDKGASVHIRYGSDPWPNQRSAKLFDEALAPVAHPDLATEDWHHLPRIAVSGPRLGWADWNAPGPAADLRFDSMIAALAAAEAGHGVLLASLPLASAALAANRVVRLGQRSLRPDASYWLLAPPAQCSDAQWRALTRAFCQGD